MATLYGIKQDSGNMDFWWAGPGHDAPGMPAWMKQSWVGSARARAFSLEEAKTVLLVLDVIGALGHLTASIQPLPAVPPGAP